MSKSTLSPCIHLLFRLLLQSTAVSWWYILYAECPFMKFGVIHHIIQAAKWKALACQITCLDTGIMRRPWRWLCSTQLLGNISLDLEEIIPGIRHLLASLWSRRSCCTNHGMTLTSAARFPTPSPKSHRLKSHSTDRKMTPELVVDIIHPRQPSSPSSLKVSSPSSFMVSSAKPKSSFPQWFTSLTFEMKMLTCNANAVGSLKEAHMALEENPVVERQLECLQTLVRTLCEKKELSLLTRLPYAC